MNVDIFGYVAAILTTAAFLPQLIKTIKTKKIGRNLDIFRITVEENFSKSIIMSTPGFNK